MILRPAGRSATVGRCRRQRGVCWLYGWLCGERPPAHCQRAAELHVLWARNSRNPALWRALAVLERPSAQD
jgi:hypothetical protein